jgi:hypothetical protein
MASRFSGIAAKHTIAHPATTNVERHGRRFMPAIISHQPSVRNVEVESLTPVDDPIKSIVHSDFNGAKAGDEREVCGTKRFTLQKVRSYLRFWD